MLYVLSAAAVAAGLLEMSSCSSIPQDYTRGPLADQILRPLPGHTGLVNGECKHDPKLGSCAWDYAEYDLNDAPTRQRLRDAGFICEVSGKAYRIALEQPGLIYETYDQSCFIGICGPKHERVIDFIPISSYQSLIDQKTQCESVFTYKYYQGVTP